MTNPSIGQSDLDDLTAWLDEELGESRSSEVRQRIESDPAWQATTRELRAVDRALETLEAPAAPDDLAQRILAGIRGRRSRRPARVYKLYVPLVAAAAAALAVVLVLSRQEHAPQDPIVQNLNIDFLLRSVANDPDVPAEKQDAFRAFYGKSAEEQRAMLQSDPRLKTLLPEVWMRIVANSFTPQEREALRTMSPTERQRRMEQRKKELIERGRLKLE